jgi:two-component system cell cycle sensor histidine kinase PleC
MTQVTAEMIERGRNDGQRVNLQRRQIAARVRDVREKLTSTAGHRAFDVELLDEFAQSRQVSAPATLGLAVTIAAISSFWVPIPYVLLWITLVSAAALLSYCMAAKYLALPEPQPSIQYWQRMFAGIEGAQGLAWALSALMLGGVEDPAARLFLLMVLLLAGAMNTMLSSAQPAAVYAGLAPVSLTIILFAFVSHQKGTTPLMILSAIAMICLIILARRLYTNALAAMILRKEKDLLIAELEQEKASSDEARRRAEEANLAKSRFLATMSHELRTPLNAILGFSEVMKGELFGPHSVPSYKNYSQDIHNSGEHLLMLINEILDLSRVEAGRYELKEESVSLAAVVEDCTHLLSLRAKKREITVVEQVEDRLPRIWADERAMRQVVLNLLTNAIKFTPQGGTITIKVGWTGGGGQYVSIRDTGPGIPPEEIPVVLSSFGRGTMAQKNADEGSGLGLPIVKGLVELHGGTFTLKSEVRVGTEVIFVLPPNRVMSGLPQIGEKDDAQASAPPTPVKDEASMSGFERAKARISLRRRSAA